MLSSIAAKPIKELLGQKVDGKAADKLKTAGALAVTLSSQAANASIAAPVTATAPAIYTAGDVSVVSRVVDAGVRSNADASTSSQNPTAATKGQTTAGERSRGGRRGGPVPANNSNAFIGPGAIVNAARLVFTGDDGDANHHHLGDLRQRGNLAWAKINGNLGIVNQIPTSYANAASTATNLDIAGRSTTSR